MTIDICTRDLFFIAKLRALLAGLPAEVRSRTPGAASARPADLTILDLGLPLEIVRAEIVAAEGHPVIAYGPHVATDLLAQARDFGCAAVLTHGALEQRLRPTAIRLLALPPES